MAIERYRPKDKSLTSAPVQRLELFGPPLLLEGEDAAIYDELLARMYTAVKPVDIIDEMFLADLVVLEWEIVRLRRLKLSLLTASGHKALADFLTAKLDYDLYTEAFEETLAEALQEKLAEDEAQELAYQFVRSESDSEEKVNKLLTTSLYLILHRAKAKRASELAEEYARREPDAIKLVNELLASSGLTMHDMMAKGFTQEIDVIERIDRLIAIAETRRNASLREIDRHRAVLGDALRRNVQDAEFEVI
jgi:hypothetical protein